MTDTTNRFHYFLVETDRNPFDLMRDLDEVAGVEDVGYLLSRGQIGESKPDNYKPSDALALRPQTLYNLIESALYDSNLEGWTPRERRAIEAFLTDLGRAGAEMGHLVD